MNEATSPTAPLAAFPPQPEEYRSRASEFYGFVAWSSTYLLFVLFILWSVLPDEWIVWSGVSWYPNRYLPRPALHSGFYLRSDTGNGRCCFQRGRWFSSSSHIPPTSLWPCLPPPPSRISPQSPVRPSPRPPLSSRSTRPSRLQRPCPRPRRISFRRRAYGHRDVRHPNRARQSRLVRSGVMARKRYVFTAWVLSRVHNAMRHGETSYSNQSKEPQIDDIKTDI